MRPSGGSDMKRHPRTLVSSITAIVVLQILPVYTFGVQSGSALPQQRRARSGATRNQKAAKQEHIQAESSVVLSANEVLVDVVVRDRKGRPLKDLSPSDFQVFEDGKRQQVESVRVHQRDVVEDSQRSANATKDNDTLKPGLAQNPFSGVNVVALVFDGLELSARVLAQKAALKCIADTFQPNDFAGVFSIDTTLRVFQPFTNNRELVARAINRIGTTTTAKSEPGGTSVQAADPAQYLATANGNSGDPLNTVDVMNPNGNANAILGNPGGRAGEAAGRMNANLVHAFQTLDRTEQGLAELKSLLAIVDSLRTMEGRKAVVLFSEGMAVDAATYPRFRDLIQEARRADVTFYSIDAAGLRAVSPIAQTAKTVNSLAMNRADSALGGGEDTSGRPMSFDAEDNVTNLFRDPRSTLIPLAEQTGGFFIDQTNDLRPGLLRIGEDIRSYYVLTYAPLNQDYDGKFREISVKVNRPGVHVEARKGYYAMRKPVEMQVPDWESPAIAVLKSGRNENSFPIRARVFSFPSDENSGLLPVLVEVPGSGVTLNVDKAVNTFKTDFSIVAVVKDLSDQIVAKVGNHYQVSGPLDKLEAARHGDFRFYREIDLPPGLYFVETVAYDTATGKASTRGASIDVPYYGGTDHLRVSSLVLVRSAEPASEVTGQDYNLLLYGQAIIYPNMGEALSKSGNKELAFYVDVYPGKSGASPRKLSVEVLQNDRVVSRGTPALPAPDAAGQIQYSGAVPLEAFKPGRYSLRVTVSEGRDSVSRSTGFTVQP